VVCTSTHTRVHPYQRQQRSRKAANHLPDWIGFIASADMKEKTGNSAAIFSNSASVASLLTGTCGRAPGARCRYALKIGHTLVGGNFFELNVLAVAASKNRFSGDGTHVLYPLRVVSDHGDQVPLPVENSHYLTTSASGTVRPDFCPVISTVA
jgi:hypothetical protein